MTPNRLNRTKSFSKKMNVSCHNMKFSPMTTPGVLEKSLSTHHDDHDDHDDHDIELCCAFLNQQSSEWYRKKFGGNFGEKFRKLKKRVNFVWMSCILRACVLDVDEIDKFWNWRGYKKENLLIVLRRYCRWALICKKGTKIVIPDKDNFAHKYLKTIGDKTGWWSMHMERLECHKERMSKRTTEKDFNVICVGITNTKITKCAIRKTTKVLQNNGVPRGVINIILAYIM